MQGIRYPGKEMMFVILMLTVLSGTFAVPESTTTEVNPINRQGRDYFPPTYYNEEEKTKFGGYAEYPPSNYVTYKEDLPPNCPPSPLIPILNNGLNFLLLKLGALGLIKSVTAVVFVILLMKLPILLAKFAFVKALLFPAVLAPLIMLFSGTMGNMMNMMKPNRPNDNNNNNNNNNNGNTGTGTGSGRGFEDPLNGVAWQSFRLLMDSEKCMERMACQFGVLNNDTTSGAALARMAKYVEHSSPAGARFRIRSLREAFSEGNSAGTCPSEAYPCEAPHLFLKHGDASLRIV